MVFFDTGETRPNKLKAKEYTVARARKKMMAI